MDEEKIREVYKLICPHLNEKLRRLYIAGEALKEGRGGISKLSRITGLSRDSIRSGIKELENEVCAPVDDEIIETRQARIRKEGGGRKKLTDKDPLLQKNLELLLEPATRGDPESPLLWSSKSVRKLAEELTNQGHTVSYETVRAMLLDMGYSLQANFKTIEENQPADRNEQFEYIYQNLCDAQSRNQPVISIDTKKRELVGNYKNNGKEWRPKKDPIEVNGHDFIDKELGKVIPFGVYDITNNQGWVSIGIDHDTSQFAVSSIRSWWNEMGKAVYPQAEELIITADSGGSNGNRRRLWKTELQKFADETGLTLHILHFPRGTSKWNKIEHQMFSYITKNWRGKPLVSLEVIVSLIANTTTQAGLKINCAVDKNQYPTGIKVTDSELNNVNLHRDSFHGDWNYKIYPHSK